MGDKMLERMPEDAFREVWTVWQEYDVRFAVADGRATVEEFCAGELSRALPGLHDGARWSYARRMLASSAVMPRPPYLEEVYERHPHASAPFWENSVLEYCCGPSTPHQRYRALCAFWLLQGFMRERDQGILKAVSRGDATVLARLASPIPEPEAALADAPSGDDILDAMRRDGCVNPVAFSGEFAFLAQVARADANAATLARFAALLARMAQRHALWLLASFVLAVGDGDVDVAPARVEIEARVRMALPGRTLGARTGQVLRAFAGTELAGVFDDMCRQWLIART